jgi:choline dehydrogenase-like flavoprotein
MSAYIDASKVAPATVLDTDVCIVGGGVAGLTLAAEFAKQGILSIVLEGGGEALTGESQSLYAGVQTGLEYFDLTACRLRFLGGTSNHWGGVCRENDPIDYEPRPKLGFPGWPIGYKDIRPYVVKAAESLGFDVEGFAPQRALAKMPSAKGGLLDELSPYLETKVFLISEKLRFSEMHRDALVASKSVRVITNANAVGVRLNEQGTWVRHIDFKTHSGNRFKVKAKQFVIATHGVENARLLLASRDVQEAGIGNQYGHVGRYFMEHPHLVSGLFFQNKKFPSIYSLANLRRYSINANLTLSREAMVQHKILQYYCRFVPIYGFERTEAALEKVYDGFWAPMDVRTLKSMARITQRPFEAMRAAAYRLGAYQPEPLAYSLDHRIEQAPNAESRITLSENLDALGVPIVKLNWALKDIDYRTFSVGQRLVTDELRRLGMGSFKLEEITPDLVGASVEGHYHHIGTTRMGRSVRDSVVNSDCRVHDVGNLYMAGSSVFPTSGYSGPTMMVVAFTLRLADYIKSNFAKHH